MVGQIWLESSGWLAPETEDQNGKLELGDSCFILVSVCVIWRMHKFCILSLLVFVLKYTL